MAQDEEARVVPRGTFCGQLTIPQRSNIQFASKRVRGGLKYLGGRDAQPRTVPDKPLLSGSMDTLFHVEHSKEGSRESLAISAKHSPYLLIGG